MLSCYYYYPISSDDQQQQQVISWTKRIAAAGSLQDAFGKFWEMQQWGLKPDRVTFLTLLNLCASQRGLREGRCIHALILQSPLALADDLPLANALTDMYCKNGQLQDGHEIFNTITRHRGDVICWNAMLTAYAQRGQPLQALNLFCAMQLEGLFPDAITFTLVLSCINSLASAAAASIHSRITDAGWESDLILGTGLVNMYARLGLLQEAQSVFDKITQQGGCGDVILWTSMIGALAQSGDSQSSLKHFRRMQQVGVSPNRITFITVLSACDSAAWLREGIRIHDQIIAAQDERMIRKEISTMNAVMSMYLKCDDLNRAARLFFENDAAARDVISWNTMIAGYSSSDSEAAFRLLWEMLQDGGADPERITAITLANACSNLEQGKMLVSLIKECGSIDEADEDLQIALIHMCARCCCPKAACDLFNNCDTNNPSSWAAMITAFTNNALHEEALSCFRNMLLEGIRAECVALTAALDSAAESLDCKSSKIAARSIQSAAEETGLLKSHPVVATALIHVLGKLGAVDEAYGIFCSNTNNDSVSWNAMLQVYAQHGHSNAAIALFREMQQQGMRPNDVTFVSLLSLCSHGGLVEAGNEMIFSMIVDHGICIEEMTGELFGCLIDLFGRVGRLEDAHQALIDHSSIVNCNRTTTVVQWMALLCAARAQGDVERINCAAKQVLELDPANSSAFVALANANANANANAIAQSV